ncbi:VanZ family protein [Paenibacillus sp. MWE-103]|uniref:VanZ family protein n=1 Tax=Paenibacillus artemisiicola TaxID=1172618 RepID=A0ABS3W374_9BACL|nr:VanZ family protein [Paenibacillus artemisiicola]MBO7742757.1 VanZ family protein [Paenibacillus artemisiicola]
MKEKLAHKLELASFVLYMYVLFKIVLFKFNPISPGYLWAELLRSVRNPQDVGWRVHAGNLVPFEEISRTVHVMTPHGFVNVAGNVAIFLPFGVFLGLLSRNGISLFGALICSFGLSFCFESAQAVFAIGRFDVDDMILNSAGGLLGCIGYRLLAANPFRGRTNREQGGRTRAPYDTARPTPDRAANGTGDSPPIAAALTGAAQGRLFAAEARDAHT